MPFITGAIAAIGSAVTAVSGFVAGLGVVGKALLSFGLSMGLSALSSALGQKSQATEPGEIAATLQVGGNIPRQVALGYVALKGQLVFAATSGVANERLLQVFVLSDGWCDGLDALWIGSEVEEIAALPPDRGATQKFTIARFGDTGFGDQRLVIWFYDGRPGQPAPGRPQEFAPDRWGPNDRLAGMAYAVVELINNNDTFDSIPDFLWVLRGYRCHDPRKDPAYGGAGSHSLADPASWEFSANPAVHVWNYLRGIRSEGHAFMGLELADYDVMAESVIAAANICDEWVPLEAGGGEPRYRASTVLTAQEADHRSALAPLIQAMAGYLVERNGAFGLLAGAAQLPVATITDADIDWTRGVRWSGSRSRTERTNEVHGQFVDPVAQWQANSYPPVTSSVFSAEDGERLAVQLDFGAIISSSQAQRAARIRMRETRRQASGSLTCGFHLLWLEPGDWITWSSATFKASRIYRIVSRELNPDDTVTLSLQEVGNEIYSWNAADEVPYLPPASPPGEPPLPTTVTNFTVQADVLTAEDGSQRPIVHLRWDPIEDLRVIAVIIEYRPVGLVAATRIRDDSPADGEYVLDQPPTGLDYEFRASIATVPARPVTWTPWVTMAAIDPAGVHVDLEDLFGQARENVESIARIGEGTIRGEIKKLGDKIEQLAADAATEAGHAYQKRDLIKVEYTGGLTRAFAAIEREEYARVSENEATAGVITALAVRLDGVQAGQFADAAAIQSLTTTVTNHNGQLVSQSQAITSLTSRIGTAEGQISTQATATQQLTTRVSNAEGVNTAQASSITALNTTVGQNSATLTQYGTSINGINLRYGVTGTINGQTGGFHLLGALRNDGTAYYAFEIHGSLVVTGTISGAKLQAYDIISNSAQIGSLTVDNISIKNGAVSNSAAVGSGATAASLALTVRSTGRVLLNAQFNGESGIYRGVGFDVGVLRIWRNGSVIAQIGTSYEGSGNSGFAGIAMLATPLLALDAPGAGTHTYTVETTNGVGVGGVTLIATELSK